jgi:hypothetical protein
LTPELSSALRSVLIAIGMLGVTKGWYDAAALGTLVDYIIGWGGATLTLGAAAWGIYAKRASSTEAQKIAGKVQADPIAQPILPTSPLDEKAKDAHL